MSQAPLSPIFEFAERFVDEQSALDPNTATGRGIAGFDHLLTDLSPKGYETRAAHMRAALAELRALPVTTGDDRRARAFIAERFETALAAFDAGNWLRTISAIAWPAGNLRSTFDLMTRESEAAWSNIVARVAAVPSALVGLQETYELGRARGLVAARRQALAAAEQVGTWATNEWFNTLVDEAAARSDVSAEIQADLATAAKLANDAFGAFAAYLRDDYAPSADPNDACGPVRYALGVRAMLGADLDPAEMYEWAWGDFHHLRSEIAKTCEQILPGGSFAEVIELLDTDPRRPVRCTPRTSIKRGCRR